MKKFVLMALSLSFLSLCFTYGKDFTLSPQSYIGFEVKSLVSKQSKGISRILAANSHLQISISPHLAEK